VDLKVAAQTWREDGFVILPGFIPPDEPAESPGGSHGRRARRLVLGLLPDLPRKNCWTIAEWAGESTSDAMQHLVSRAKWDADAVRDDLWGYVVEHLHDEQAVLVVDETGDIYSWSTAQSRSSRA
jgi:hypothetical protein